MGAAQVTVTIPTPFKVRQHLLLPDADGHLANYVWSASIMFFLMLAWFGWMQYQEHTHPRQIADINVNFEFYCAPPEPSFRVRNQLAPLPLALGSKPVVTAAALPRSLERVLTASRPTEAKSASSAVVKSPPSQSVPEVPVAMVTPASAATLDARVHDADASPALVASASVPQATADVRPASAAPAALGKGDTSSLAGSDFNANEAVARLPSKISLTTMGNIRPYTADMIARIGQRWRPAKQYGSITLELALDRDGNLLSSAVVSGSGSKKLDHSLLEALETVEFAPLPEWYKGEHLKFQIVLSDS